MGRKVPDERKLKVFSVRLRDSEYEAIKKEYGSLTKAVRGVLLAEVPDAAATPTEPEKLPAAPQAMTAPQTARRCRRHRTGQVVTREVADADCPACRQQFPGL